MLQREGFELSEKVVFRLYRAEGLSLRYRLSRRRRMQATRPMRSEVLGPDVTWRLGSVADQRSRGARFRAPTVADIVTHEAFTREALALEVGQRLRSQDVLAALERLRQRRGRPESLRCDNSSEFISHWWTCGRTRTGCASTPVDRQSPPTMPL